MYNATILQSVICPIVSYSENKIVNIQKYFGTGFFFNTEGFFLTAKHVIEEGKNQTYGEVSKLGIYPILDDLTKIETSYSKLIFPILEFEFAPEPFDIAICKTDYAVNTWLRLEEIEIKAEQKVSLFGWYLDDSDGEKKSLFTPRCYRGKIKTIISNNTLDYGNDLSLFKPSFPLRYGLSGCPLFVESNNSTFVIGTSIDSYRLRNKDYKTIKFNDEKLETNESYSDLKQYFGIIQDIRPLLDWKPNILNGKTLTEISTNFLK